MKKYYIRTIHNAGKNNNRLVLRLRNYDMLESFCKWIHSHVRCIDCYVLRPDMAIIEFKNNRMIAKEYDKISKVLGVCKVWRTRYCTVYDTGNSFWVYPERDATSRTSSFIRALLSRFPQTYRFEYGQYDEDVMDEEEFADAVEGCLKSDYRTIDNMKLVDILMKRRERFFGLIKGKHLEVSFETYSDGSSIKPVIIRVDEKHRERFLRQIESLGAKSP
jgi:hypothetical protein